MGLFDWLWKDATCPACGREFAKKRGNKVKCRNKECKNFDMDLFNQPEPHQTSRDVESPRTLRGNFDPGANSIEIHYTNYRGDTKTFTGDRTSFKTVQNHLSVRLAPTGTRVTLARERITNLDHLLQYIHAGPEPTSREKQVLAYHKKRRSTSPLYEELRHKYPNW